MIRSRYRQPAFWGLSEAEQFDALAVALLECQDARAIREHLLGARWEIGPGEHEPRPAVLETLGRLWLAPTPRRWPGVGHG